jgi:phage gpG-like protein
MRVEIKIKMEEAAAALARYGASLQNRSELLATLGAGQLVSIRRTFYEEGSPTGSWPQLSPVSLRWKKYTDGHKLLIGTSLLLNSINAQTNGNTVVIGTNVRYAGVHQFGYFGPQSVKGYSFSRSVARRDGWEKSIITNKLGRNQMVNRKIVGGVEFVTVKPFTRTVHIPARPFMVLRPEDRGRMEEQVNLFLQKRAKESGLA